MKTLALLRKSVSICLLLIALEVVAMPTKPAVNEPPVATAVGSLPYEMEGRSEDRVPLFGFEDLSGWTVECLEGADADLVRTREQQMWGTYVGKLTYKGQSTSSRVILRPPSPIRIPDYSDSVSMWIYGNLWEWAPDPGTPFLDVSILITDSLGKERSIPLTRIRWKEWWLAHKKLTPLESSAFSGIEITGMSNSEPRSVFFDSIYFYKEELSPLTFDPRPARNLTPFPGQNHGLNGTGPGTLPFPTREETILPSNFVSEYENSVRESGPGEYEFSYSGKDCRLKYVYRPARGDLGEIVAYVNGRKACVPMAGGGIESVDGKVHPARLISASSDDDTVVALFDLGDGVNAEYRIGIRQKSLILDFICRGGKVGGVSLGEVRGIRNPKLILIPYLTFGASNPRVLCFSGPSRHLFASVWVDWYRSNGSMLWSQEWAQLDSARINGGVRYITKTDGKRNDLYERVLLTISPMFEETLPTIANPPTPHGAIAGERLWQESWGPDDYEKQHQRSRMLRSYGIEKLTQCNHEITWRDGGESFTLRTKAAPAKGGDEALKKYVAAQKSLGWLSGLYTNYTDFAPVNEYWNEDYVQLTPEGEWRPAWPRCYALKPSRAVELDSKLAPVIQKKFGSNAAYTDVHTAVPPWAYCDFDARVPGAGTFAATFYAYGELLLNDQKVYGPTWSEGSYQWMYAGLATGNYALAYTGVDLSKEPLQVAFDLLKIHPLECDIGMPWTGGFFKEAGWDTPDRIDESIDHFIAATIAYGHIGWLVEEQHGIQRTCRSYYMLQQLQKRYSLRPPVLIEYADAQGRWLSASKAIATDVILDSRLHVRYDNGLDVYVNGSRDTWTVRKDGRELAVLPSWGWYACHPDSDFREFSAIVDGRRIDYVHSPDYEYLDGRGVATVYAGLGATGSIAVRKKHGSFEIIDIHGNDWIGLSVSTPGTCVAYDPEGKYLGRTEVRLAQDGMAWFRAIPNARRYLFTPSHGGRSATIVTISGADHLIKEQACDVRISVTTPHPAHIVEASVQVESEPPIRITDWLPGRRPNEYYATVRLQAPETASIGSRVWTRVTVRTGARGPQQTAEIWHWMRVVPALEIGIQQTGDHDFLLSFASNLWKSDAHSLITLRCEPSGVFDVSPTTLSLQTTEKRLQTPVHISVRSNDPQPSADLVVSVDAGVAKLSRRWHVRSIQHFPSVWKVDYQTPLSAGAVFRDGRVVPVGVGSGASVQLSMIPCGGVTKFGIFSHPPYEGGIGYTYLTTGHIQVPNEECYFRTFIGLKDGGYVSDGVTFTVLALTDDGGEHTIFAEHWDKREWKEVTADLSPFRGQRIRLKFVADVGPNDDSTADWASWGEPRITLKKPITKIELTD